jgi:hypothetical protein
MITETGLRRQNGFILKLTFLMLGAALFFGAGFPEPAAARSKPKPAGFGWSTGAFSPDAFRPPFVVGRQGGWGGTDFDRLPPEEKARIMRQYKEWQSLPPEQKDAMRRRYDEYNRMPPQDRERYQQRYKQWQRLSPEEQRQLENNLQRWDSLSPQERESIRRRFK